MIFVDKLGEVRPNQLITAFGPGAIIEALNDSLTVLDLGYWNNSNKGKEIYDTRLAAYMNVKHFYMPKTGGTEDIPVVSFPYYHVCSNVKCQALFDMRKSFDIDKYKENKGQVKCPYCSNANAYPSRFITICEDGHMDDFPWKWWVHKGSKTCEGKLTLSSNGQTSSLAELTVKCSCGAKRSMAGATQKENFEGLQCSGNHPHRPFVNIKPCKNQVIPSQRGASNVYFGVVRSAISIPPWIDPINDILSENRVAIDALIETFDGMNEHELGMQKVYEKFFSPRFTREEFDSAYERLKEKIKEYTDLKEMEYKAITHHQDLAYQKNVKYFKANEVDVDESFKPWIMRIIQIQRLREVRVLTGFTRLEAPDPEIDEQKHIVKLQSGEEDNKWLPVVEINGEGVFIELNPETIAKWLENPMVAERSKKYTGFYSKYCEDRGWQNFKSRDAKYVLLHTLAHLLIKEMAIKSGYSSTSIRERIYSSDDMHGILLYTGAADKEGSLGGLVELGKMSKFRSLLKDAFEHALVCTTDPECFMKEPTKSKINGASCHSCTMISETACENGNRLLDRALVVPLSEHEEMGFFKDLIEDLCGILM